MISCRLLLPWLALILAKSASAFIFANQGQRGRVLVRHYHIVDIDDNDESMFFDVERARQCATTDAECSIEELEALQNGMYLLCILHFMCLRLIQASRK